MDSHGVGRNRGSYECNVNESNLVRLFVEFAIVGRELT